MHQLHVLGLVDGLRWKWKSVVDGLVDWALIHLGPSVCRSVDEPLLEKRTLNGLTWITNAFCTLSNLYQLDSRLSRC